MLILDIPNLKFVDVHLVFFSKKTTTQQTCSHLQPSETKETNEKTPGTICEHKDRVLFKSANLRYLWTKILQLEYQVSHIPSIHWWWFTIFLQPLFCCWGWVSFLQFIGDFLPSFFWTAIFFRCWTVGWEELPLKDSWWFLPSFFWTAIFFRCWTVEVGRRFPKKKVEDWKSKGGFENC